MVEKKYIDKIAGILKEYLAAGDRVFIFGSAADSERFNDIDLGILSDDIERTDKATYKIKNDLEESTLPYKFDVVNINKTNDRFRVRVMGGPKIWII
jgi:predicted nucleotidyltransferase